jgi:hypothetical protein
MGWAASLTPMVDQDTMDIDSMRLPRGRNIGVREAAHKSLKVEAVKTRG